MNALFHNFIIKKIFYFNWTEQMFFILCSFSMESCDCFSNFNSYLDNKRLKIYHTQRKNVLMGTTYISNKIGNQNSKRPLWLFTISVV